MKKYLTILCIFLLGIVIGGSTVNLINGRIIENLSFENESYKMKNDLLNEKINKLNDAIKAKSFRVITDITPYINNDDKKIKIEIEKYIKSKLKDIYGKNVDKIEPILIYKIFDGRILTIENKKIILKVRYIIINANLEIYVDTTIKES